VGRLHLTATKRLALTGVLLFGAFSTVAAASSWIRTSAGQTKVGSVTKLHVSPTRAGQGQTVTFIAKVKFGTAGAPEGTRVVFAVDGKLVASVATNARGVATFSTSTLVGGRHVVTASYRGSATVNPSRDARKLIVACPGRRCESLLADPRPAVGIPVHAGQTLTIVAMDEVPLGTRGALAPHALLSTGQSLVVTTKATARQAARYVDSNGRARGSKHQLLLSFTLPSGLAPGRYTILVTAYATDGDADQWYWPIRIPGTELPYTVGGSTTAPLYPGGRPSPIDLSFSNSNAGGSGAAGVLVANLIVRISAISAPAATPQRPCRASDFAVTQFLGAYPFQIPEGSSTLQSLGFPENTWPTVRLRNRPVNQNGCKGATVMLAYAGTP